MTPAGRRVLVTGTASGIGQALVQQLVAAGAVVTSLDRAKPSTLVDTHIPVDLADLHSLDATLGRLDGRWDSVCNVAGVVDGPADQVFAVNFLAVRHISESLIRQLRPGGAIVNVASTSSHGWPNHMDTLRPLLATADFAAGARWYAEHGAQWPAEPLSKEALVAYTKMRGPQLIPQQVRMNAVSPGPVATPLLEGFGRTISDRYLDEAQRHFDGSFESDSLARIIAFLASPDSEAINGHNIIADGGLLGRV